jgi:hypothetical protein
MEKFKIVPNNINNASTAPDFIECGHAVLDNENRIWTAYVSTIDFTPVAIIDLNTYSIFKQ